MNVPPQRTQQPSRWVTMRLSCRHSAVRYGLEALQVRHLEERVSRPQFVQGRNRGISQKPPRVVPVLLHAMCGGRRVGLTERSTAWRTHSSFNESSDDQPRPS